MKNTFILTITLYALLTTSLMAQDKPSQKIPFTGMRVFNFEGGNSTGESITIKKNGYTILEACADAGEAKLSCTNIYKGKYSNPLPAGDDEGGKYLINENKIYYLKKNDEVKTGCIDENEPCVSELTKP